MKESVINKILCTSGYLPPRDENEAIEFEKVYANLVVRDNFHIDVDNIVKGVCPIKPITRNFGRITAGSQDMRIAARNFESLPKELVEKIKNQHTKEDD